MKRALSKTEAQKLIAKLFQKESFSAEEVKKIKRLAMKFNIKLGSYRRQFCKKCLSQLKGTIQVTKKDKNTICNLCGYRNRIKL